MTDRQSFAKYENQVLPGFRRQLSQAESTEDAKKFFAYAVRELLGKVFDDKLPLENDDLVLDSAKQPYFRLSEALSSNEVFQRTLDDSDLPNILTRLAETAVHRHQHLKKNREKTESKIRG